MFYDAAIPEIHGTIRAKSDYCTIPAYADFLQAWPA